MGNHIEANDELDSITAESRAPPDALKVRWEVYAAAKKWEAALDIADALARLAPNKLALQVFRLPARGAVAGM